MTTSTDRPTGSTPFAPSLTAGFGLVVYALSIAAGIVFDLNADAPDSQQGLREWVITALIALAGVGLAVWVGRRAWSGTPSSLARTALVLAIVAAVAVVVFWAGWTNVFGAVAVGLALEHRRRIGSFGAATATAAVLGGVAFVAGAVLCVIG